MPDDESDMLRFLLKYLEIVEIGQKIDFLGDFESFFVHAFLHLMS